MWTTFWVIVITVFVVVGVARSSGGGEIRSSRYNPEAQRDAELASVGLVRPRSEVAIPVPQGEQFSDNGEPSWMSESYTITPEQQAVIEAKRAAV